MAIGLPGCSIVISVPIERDQASSLHLVIEVFLVHVVVISRRLAHLCDVLGFLDTVVSLLPAVREFHLVQPARQVRFKRDVLVQDGPLRCPRLLLLFLWRLSALVITTVCACRNC